MDDDETCSEASTQSDFAQTHFPKIINQLIEHVRIIRRLEDEMKEIRDGLVLTNESIGQLRGQLNKLQGQLQELITPAETEYEMLHGDDI